MLNCFRSMFVRLLRGRRLITAIFLVSIVTFLVLIGVFRLKDITDATSGGVVNHEERVASAKPLPTPSKGPPKNKIILLWTEFMGRDNYFIGFGNQPFLKNGCNESRCEITKDRNRLKEADVVMFHPVDIQRKKGADSLVKDFDFPPFKPRGQRWVFLSLEPPSQAFLNLGWPNFDTDVFGPVFNWTMTYRRDSDVPIPYGYKIRKKKVEAGLNINYAAQKTRLAAWFVSNCDVVSKRDKYVEKLRRHIPVDVYGKCGDKKCSRRNESGCNDMLNRHYKFYLAFENDLCYEYISAKIWRTLTLTTAVPVVLGGADYHNLLPPGSYIDALKFSPQELAEYLKSIDDKRFNEFHEWRKRWDAKEGGMLEGGFCKLCDYMHRKVNDPPKWYEKLRDFWFGERDCYPELITWA